MRPKFKIALFKGKTLKDGSHPIMINLYYNSRIKRYGTGLWCRVDQWHVDTRRLLSNFPLYDQKNLVLNAIELKIDGILDEYIRFDKPFSFQSFDSAFKGKKIHVIPYYNQLIKEMTASDRVGSLNIYKETRKLLMEYKSSSISFVDITPGFLDGLEVYLRTHRSCSGGGISVYMRNIRTVLLRATRDGYVPRSSYPFKSHYQHGYDISRLKSDFNPRGLSIDDMDKVKKLATDCPEHLQKSVRYFLLSYYCRGMAFTDMALLTWEMIYDNRITYRRSKSKSLISIAISDPIEKLLQTFQGTESDWVLPIISTFHETGMQRKNRIKKCLKFYNKDLKEIQEVLGIKTKLTSYTARHTYAKVLRESGISTEVISAGLGHSELQTTKHYLAQLGCNHVDVADKSL